MKLAEVIGTVVLTKPIPNMELGSYRVLQPINTKGQPIASTLVAYDLLGARPQEWVLVAQGSSCRQGPALNQAPVDAVVAGIVDLVEKKGQVVFHKKEQP